MNVLVIAPHMDDEVLGVGGTIARHMESGDQVTVCVVGNRAYNHTYQLTEIEREKSAARRAQKVLGYQNLHFLDLPDEQLDHRLQDIIIPLEEIYNGATPDVAYVNHGGDLNQDHQAVFRAAMVVCRAHTSHKLQALYCYETPSSTDQAPPLPAYAFLPNHYVGIENHLDQKLEALSCYEEESRSFPHPRSSEGITVYAKKRGSEVGLPAAEAFMLMRKVVW
jgi:LmbE family N-acetylglucosaminyl deacetylase